MKDLTTLLADVDDHVRVALDVPPAEIDRGDYLDVTQLPTEPRTWHKLSDTLAVLADMKNSTKLGKNKSTVATASIYDAATGGVVHVFSDFEADYIAVQGDGALALFWGSRRYERAVCAGITIKTFSADSLVPRLEKKWPDIAMTGLKVGIGNSPLLVRRIGNPRWGAPEPVWAGHAVNYAAKAAQQASRHQMIVTAGVWNWISGNEYLTLPCPCLAPIPPIWMDATIFRLPEGDPDRSGKLLLREWCPVHGPGYCAAVLAGQSARPDAGGRARAPAILARKRFERRWRRAVRPVPGAPPGPAE